MKAQINTDHLHQDQEQQRQRSGQTAPAGTNTDTTPSNGGNDSGVKNGRANHANAAATASPNLSSQYYRPAEDHKTAYSPPRQMGSSQIKEKDKVSPSQRVATDVGINLVSVVGNDEGDHTVATMSSEELRSNTGSAFQESFSMALQTLNGFASGIMGTASSGSVFQSDDGTKRSSRKAQDPSDRFVPNYRSEEKAEDDQTVNDVKSDWTMNSSIPSFLDAAIFQTNEELGKPLSRRFSGHTGSSYSTLSTPFSSGGSSIPDTPTRAPKPPTHAASPMARMRSGAGSQENAEQSDAETPRRNRAKTQEQVKAQKQKQWKKKMRLAQKKQRQERQHLGYSDETPQANDGIMNRMLGKILPDPKQFMKMIDAQCFSNCDTLERSESDLSSQISQGSWKTESDVGGPSTPRRPTVAPSPSRGGLNLCKTAQSETSSPSWVTTQLGCSRTEKPITSKRKTKVVKAKSERALPLPDLPGYPDKDYVRSEASSAIVADLATVSIKRRTSSRVGKVSKLDPLEAEIMKSQLEENASQFIPNPISQANPNDKSFVKSFIYELSTQGSRFSWYKEQSSMKPIRIVLFLKQGYMTGNGRHCGPRLAWCDVQSDSIYGIDLFEISSLQKASIENLRDYPFALPARSIFLQLTRNRDFVFEAETEEEAQKFIHGLRWVVARMAFNLVVGNLDVSCELLDVGADDDDDNNDGVNDRLKHQQTRSPQTPMEEARWSKAMDDVTNRWIDKSTTQVPRDF